MAKIGILGAGSWGTALARTLTLSGNKVTVWSAVEREIDVLKSTRSHPNLPGSVIPKEMKLTTELSSAVSGMDFVVFAVASPYTRITARNAAPFITENQILVNVAKGLEASSHKTLTEIIEDEIPALPHKRIAALCGPTHAEELAADMPTAIVAAATDEEIAKTIQNAFSNDILRVYTNTDIKGVEICGALKNIVAIAAGISDGLGYGDNTKAAIITRGMAEITRLGSKVGGSKQTFTSLAGIGDLIVTCTSAHSRNKRAGYLIGQGMSPKDAIAEIGMVVEGVNALPAASELSAKYDVEMPICNAVSNIMDGTINARNALKILMSRGLRTEFE